MREAVLGNGLKKPRGARRLVRRQGHRAEPWVGETRASEDHATVGNRADEPQRAAICHLTIFTLIAVLPYHPIYGNARKIDIYADPLRSRRPP